MIPPGGRPPHEEDRRQRRSVAPVIHLPGGGAAATVSPFRPLFSTPRADRPMKRISVAIAGVRIDLVAHGAAAEHLLDEIEPLWSGFLVASGRTAAVECRVHYDCGRIYRRRFGSEPIIIDRNSSPWTESLGDRMGQIYPGRMDAATAVIGFLNGCLIFDGRANRGAIYIFYTKAALHVPATLWKLVFIFVCLVMAGKNRLMVHGAGIKRRRGGGGYLFLGRSGAGKSTIAALSPGEIVLSDDAPVIEAGEGGFRIHATPFTQTGIDRQRPKRWSLQKERLQRIVFLHQADGTWMAPRERHYACMELLTDHVHCYGLMEAALKRRTFDLCHRLCGVVPAADLYFRRDGGFWELVATAGG